MIRIRRPLALLAAVAACVPLLAGSAAHREAAPVAGVPPTLWAAPGTCPPAVSAVTGAPEPLSTGGHTDVRTVGFGRLDGRPIAVSAGAEGTVRFWWLPGFQPAAEPLDGTAADYVDLGGRPGVLTEGGYGARLWDLAARRVLMRFPKGSVFAQGRYRGRGALFAARGDTVRVVDPASGAVLRTIRTRGAEAIAAGTLGGREILVAYEGEERPFRVWDLVTGRTSGRGFHLGDEYATPDWMRITEIDGRGVLLVRSYLGIHRFDLALQTGRGMLAEAGENDEGDPVPYGASALVAGAGGQVLALGRLTSDPQVLHRSVPAPTVLRGMDGSDLGSLEGHRGAVTALAGGELDGRSVLLSGSVDSTVRLWDVRAREQVGGQSPEGPPDGVERAAFAELDGRPIGVTAEADGTVRTWDPARRAPAGPPMRPARGSGGEGGVSLATADLDGVPVAVTTGYPRTVTVWNLRTATELGGLPVPDSPGSHLWIGGVVVERRAAGPAAVALQPGDGGHLVHTWDLRTRRLLDSFRLAPMGGSLVVIGGRAFAILHDARRVEIWDVAAERRVSAFAVRPSSGELSIRHVGEFGCRPALLAAGGSGTVRILDPLTGADLAPPVEVGTGDRMSIVGAATLGGRTLAWVETGLDDESSHRLWDLTAGRPLGKALDEVRSSAFAAYDRYVITGGPEQGILLWPR
ncbi:WD40 repeat domain-containing protein [Nonomuraea sp. LPB2021202275-12-8]|uniref:WD40 repeat domain-containing protein n=1 Tax=Nonomuraea sp. LPB2021202275-12-8 TaxID=3120159 RepID=UPI00300C9335